MTESGAAARNWCGDCLATRPLGQAEIVRRVGIGRTSVRRLWPWPTARCP